MTNADLARATFVTRQCGNIVLRGLQEAGLISRPATADHGRARPAHLTEAGHTRLAAVQAAVHAIEQRMVEAIPPQRMTALLADLDRIAAAFEIRGMERKSYPSDFRTPDKSGGLDLVRGRRRARGRWVAGRGQPRHRTR